MVARTDSSPICSMKQLSPGLDEKLKPYYCVSGATFSMCFFKAISISGQKGCAASHPGDFPMTPIAQS